MIAAAAWLCSLVSVPYGDRAWWMVMFLVFVAVAAWVIAGVIVGLNLKLLFDVIAS